MEDLKEVEGGDKMIRIYCMRRNSIKQSGKNSQSVKFVFIVK